MGPLKRGSTVWNSARHQTPWERSERPSAAAFLARAFLPVWWSAPNVPVLAPVTFHDGHQHNSLRTRW